MLRPPAGSRKWRIAINIGGTSSVSEAFPLVCGRCRLRFTYVTPVLVKQLRVEAPGQVTFCPPWPAPGMAEDEAAELVPSGLDPGLGVFFMDLCTQQIDPSLDFDGERNGPPPPPPDLCSTDNNAPRRLLRTDNGDIARSGTTCEALLDELLQCVHTRWPRQSSPANMFI
jgi:hypothetical protein